MGASSSASGVAIEDPALIERILAHLKRRAEADLPRLSVGARSPPQPSLF
jgi:hypothetical protein